MEEKPKYFRPDDVLDQFPEGRVCITTRIISSTSVEGVPTVLIEGDVLSLRFLGQMILAQAEFPLDCGYGISPRGPGKAVFSPKAELGIYVHRLPCMDTDDHLDDEDSSCSS